MIPLDEEYAESQAHQTELNKIQDQNTARNEDMNKAMIYHATHTPISPREINTNTNISGNKSNYNGRGSPELTHPHIIQLIPKEQITPLTSQTISSVTEAMKDIGVRIHDISSIKMKSQSNNNNGKSSTNTSSTTLSHISDAVTFTQSSSNNNNSNNKKQDSNSKGQKSSGSTNHRDLLSSLPDVEKKTITTGT